jgi:hypothetical protein
MLLGDEASLEQARQLTHAHIHTLAR